MQPSSSPDKIIVDRRRTVRNADLRKTVQRTRDQLAVSTGNATNFLPDILGMFATAVVNSVLAVPLLVMLVCVTAVVIGFGLQVLIWGVVASLAYAITGLVAKHYLRAPDERAPAKWRMVFLALTCGVGLTWTYFAIDQCAQCSPDASLFLRTSAMILAIATTATICYAIPSATAVAFAIPVIAFVTVETTQPSQSSFMGIGLVVAALLFFSFISLRLNRAALVGLAYRNENQTLIAELEMAKSISDEARRRAEESNLAKSRFLASMSHELRTPLNAILGFSEAMHAEVFGPLPNAQYKSYAGDIHQSGKHLLNLINEILDLSRVEAGKYELREEPLHLSAVVEDCIALVRMKADAKSLTITAMVQSGLPKLVADEKSLRQIALNIIANALKFTPPGGEIKVKVGLTASGGQYISVSDNGPGIPDEEIPIVLAAFGQGSIAIKNAEQGTGLGLPIVQALLKMHGGMFELKSKLREGTTATAFFPASRVLEAFDLETSDKPHATEHKKPKRGLRKRRPPHCLPLEAECVFLSPQWLFWLSVA
ncbi:MAG: HAMP domain-containing sensor histidine kinase, partial [Pseudomonadota bacterium]